ncbi:MAG TPA: hypothetical protein DCO72_06150 [Ruminococcus sp.]|nr:hypothetical protein [Ruminococcus sp.]
MALKSDIYKGRVNERENMDVVSLMTLTAEKFTSDSWTAELLRRAARLLCATTDCWCDTLKALKDEEFALGNERLLRAIFERKDDDDDPDDETD